MIPLLLDQLTVCFIVAGLALLWLNLREWHRSKVIIAPREHDGFRDELRIYSADQLESSRRGPKSEVSATRARHSRVQSTTVRTRKRRQSMS